VTQKVHHQTERGGRIALAKKQISRASYEAILRGELSLAEARELGRDRGPDDTGQASNGPGTTTETPRKGRERPQGGAYCLCGCSETTRGGRFKPGHDARLHGELKRNLKNDPLLKNERLTDAQRRYAVERRLAGPEVLPEEERDG
jgi:hypothetical protein